MDADVQMPASPQIRQPAESEWSPVSGCVGEAFMKIGLVGLWGEIGNWVGLENIFQAGRLFYVLAGLFFRASRNERTPLHLGCQVPGS